MHLTHNEVYKGSILFGLNLYKIRFTKFYYILKFIKSIKTLK